MSELNTTNAADDRPLLAVAGLALVAATFSIISRFYIRGVNRRRSFGIDDRLALSTGLMYLAMFTATVFAILQINQTLLSYSFGSFGKADLISDFLSFVVIVLAKLALAATFHQSALLDRRHKVLLYGGVVILLLTGLTSCIALLGLCVPETAFWGRFNLVDGCYSPIVFLPLVPVPQLISDIVFLILPFFCGNGTPMSRAQKAAAVSLYFLGLCTASLTILREVTTAAFGLSPDEVAWPLVLANCQAAMLILVLCLSSMLPIYVRRASPNKQDDLEAASGMESSEELKHTSPSLTIGYPRIVETELQEESLELSDSHTPQELSVDSESQELSHPRMPRELSVDSEPEVLSSHRQLQWGRASQATPAVQPVRMPMF